ncbi:MAG: thiamine-phosphate kinase, partial [Candidatus Paceibacterales bacterium]
PKDGKTAWIVSTDSLVEDVHFLRNKITPFDLGFKSIAVNASDIAAMGGSPKYVFTTVAFPKNLEMRWINNFLKGIESACKENSLHLLGGDTTGSKQSIFISVTIIGEGQKDCIKYRSKAKRGDLICLTGNIGDSAAGLAASLGKKKLSVDLQKLSTKHYRPTARVQEGIWLGKQKAVNAMIDLSDGLDSDLQQILKASHKSADVDLELIPLSTALFQFCKQNAKSPLRFALFGGEDYELLFTVNPLTFDTLKKNFRKTFKQDIYPIGYIKEGSPTIRYLNNNRNHKIKGHAFNHFQP